MIWFLKIAHNSLTRVKELLRNIESGGKYSNVLDATSLQNLDLEIRYEEAVLLWDWKEKDHAKRMLKQLLKSLQSQDAPERFDYLASFVLVNYFN